MALLIKPRFILGLGSGGGSGTASIGEDVFGWSAEEAAAFDGVTSQIGAYSIDGSGYKYPWPSKKGDLVLYALNNVGPHPLDTDIELSFSAGWNVGPSGLSYADGLGGHAHQFYQVAWYVMQYDGDWPGPIWLDNFTSNNLVGQLRYQVTISWYRYVGKDPLVYPFYSTVATGFYTANATDMNLTEPIPDQYIFGAGIANHYGNIDYYAPGKGVERSDALPWHYSDLVNAGFYGRNVASTVTESYYDESDIYGNLNTSDIVPEHDVNYNPFPTFPTYSSTDVVWTFVPGVGWVDEWVTTITEKYHYGFMLYFKGQKLKQTGWKIGSI